MVLIFTVERVSSLNSGLISGVDIVSRLKKKLRTDSSLLDVEVLSVDTVGKIICQTMIVKFHYLSFVKYMHIYIYCLKYAKWGFLLL